MSKIENPVVLIHKRDNNDSYAVAITSGSKNFHDAVLMASMEPDMVGDDVDTWSKTGYYMAQEIELWRRAGALAISRLEAADDSNVWQAVGFVLGALECAAAGQIAGESNNCRSSVNVQVVQEKDGIPHAAEPVKSVDHVDGEPVTSIKTASVLDLPVKNAGPLTGKKSFLVNDGTTGKRLTITLPDISSKAFWSGNDKAEVFHPETYKRWVKEAIERDCTIANIDVKVK